MKVRLLYRDGDFDITQKPPAYMIPVAKDLELDSLFSAMARGDRFLDDVARKAVLPSTTDIDTICYRQDILRDCIKNEAVVREMYDVAVETFERKRKAYYLGAGRWPAGILSGAIGTLEILVDMLRMLRRLVDQHGAAFESDGLRTLFAMLRTELDDAYFTTISYHLKELKFTHGVLVSARLGDGNKGIDYVLRKDTTPPDWLARIRTVIEARWNHGKASSPGPRDDDEHDSSLITELFAAGPETYSFELAPRDESGAQALGQLRDRGINLVANAVAQSADHVLSFFSALRAELAFYVGCLNLSAQLKALEEPICFPVPFPPNERHHHASGLYDVCLSLNMKNQIVGNDLAADSKTLVIVTGANQGGKSTFLRSVGLAQVMMQCGMFVGATALAANVCERIFTHYKREEDAAMTSGKFDEEIARMSEIASELVPNSIVLFNESFAATNEREGSEIAREVVMALLERHVKMVFVTHQYEFALGVEDSNTPGTLFLRAERQADGIRTFKIIDGEPLETSYGEDLYNRIFTEAAG